MRFGPHHFRALGRLKRGAMNKTEAEHARTLELMRNAGAVLWWRFEPMKLRLADLTFYEPDFLVMLADGRLEVHEVKGGFITDDAMVKVKVAAEQFPFTFRLYMKSKKGWETREL